MPLPKRHQRWPPLPPASTTRPKWPPVPPTPPKYRPQSTNPITTRTHVPPTPPTHTSSMENALDSLNLEIESGVSPKITKSSKCPCSRFSFKTNAIISIVVIFSLFVIFFSLFIWAMVPKNPSNDPTQGSGPQAALMKSRIICVHHDKPDEIMLKNQCRMIKEHCDDTKVCEAIVFSSEVDADFMKYFWEQESFKVKTIFYLAVHGSKAEAEQPSSVSLWKHPELIKDVQEFYSTQPEKAKNFLLVTAACYSGRIVLEPSYKMSRFPIITAIGKTIATSITTEGRPTDELPMLMTQKVRVPDKISQSCIQNEKSWPQGIKQKFKKSVQELRSPLTELTFGMFEGIRDESSGEGNTGFAVSAPRTSPLRLKDWNLEPTDYAFRVCGTKQILSENYNVGLELHFPKQEFGISSQERSVWANKQTWILQGTTTHLGIKMSHTDYSQRYKDMDIVPFADGDKIILRPVGERILYFPQNVNFNIDPVPNEILLPIP